MKIVEVNASKKYEVIIDNDLLDKTGEYIRQRAGGRIAVIITDDVVDKLIMVCETSPNAKIKALAEQFKNQSIELKGEIVEQLQENENAFVGALEKKKTEVEILEDRIAELERLVKQHGE